jgi:hypothetical protein
MGLHHYKCFEERVRMLLQSLTALRNTPGGAGSIWEYLEVVVRATGVSGGVVYGFLTELHFPDVVAPQRSQSYVKPEFMGPQNRHDRTHPDAMIRHFRALLNTLPDTTHCAAIYCGKL